MTLDFLPTLVWLLVLGGGIALIIDAVNARVGTRQITQVLVGVVLVLAFLANAWTGFTHWAECEEHPHSDECEEDEE